MKTARLPCHSILSVVVLFALSSPVFATDYIFSGGTYVPGTTAPEPLLTPDVLQINAGANKFFDTSTMTNQSGLVNWNADSLFMQNGALIKNQSVWDAKSDNALVNNGGALPTFNNSGTFRKSAGAGTTSIGSIAFVNSGTIDAQTGTINFSGANATFNAGSKFIGAGSTVVSNNASFNGAFTSSNLSLTGGTFTGTSAQINGSVNFTGGVFTGSWEVASSQTLKGNNGGNKFMSGATFTNNGTVQWQTSDSLFMQTGSTFTNNGLYDIQITSSIVNNGGALSTFTNSSGATLRVAATQTATIGSIAFVNDGGTLTANGTLNFSGGNATFNNGTVFNGSGSTLVSNNASFNGAFTSSNLSLTGGIFTGSSAQINGSVNFTGGVFTGSWEVASGQTLNGNSGANKFMSGASFTNNGTVQWQTSDSLFMQNGSTFTNNGLYDIQASSSIVNNGGPLSTFTNSSGAFLRVAATQTATIGSIAFVNNGGTLTANGTLNFSGGNATFNNGTVFNGSGTNLISNNATFNNAFTSSNLVLQNGSYTGGSAVLSGTVDFTGGVFDGTWEVASGQVLNGKDGGNKFINGASFTNKGTVQWQTGNTLFMQNGASLDNQGLFDMQTGASIVNNGGPLSTFTNSGTLRVAAGQNSTIGSIAFVNNGGILNVGTGGSLNFAGGNVNFNAGTQFTGAGVNMVTNNANFNGSFSSTNLSLQNGAFTGSSAVFNSGSAQFAGGLFQGDWTVASGATLNGVDGGNKFLNGGTFTNQGTIAWQTGNSLFFQNGVSLANQGTIDLQTDSAMVYNGGAVGTFVNTGLITKTGGAGTSTIGNNLGFDNQGVVNVSTGIIQLPDNFTNNGTLKGTGAFTTNVLTNAGHVAPGGSSPGTLTLNGNYIQTSAGFLDTEFASSASVDKFQINGTAALDGTLHLIRLNNFAPANGAQFTILVATGGRTGQFFTVQSDFTGRFKATVIYDPNDVIVQFFVTSFILPGLTPNQLAVARELDEVASDPRAAPLISFLGAEPAGNLPRDYDLIAPEELASIYEIGFSQAVVQNNNLQRRMDDIRAGSNGFCANGFAMQASGKDYNGGKGPMISDKNVTIPDKNVAPTPAFVPCPENRWGVFVTGSGDFVNVGNDDFNAHGYDITTGDFTLGVDYRLGDHFAIGVDGGYATSTADLVNDGRVEVDGGKIGGYATVFGKGFFGSRIHVDLAGGGGWNSYDTRRTGLEDLAVRGSTNGSEVNALLAYGADWNFGCFNIGTWSTLQYTQINIDRFTEEGSLAPLEIQDQDEDSFRGTTGIRASYDIKAGRCMIIRPEVRAAWQHEYNDRSYPIDARFASGAGDVFRVHGPKIGRDAALVGAGFNIQWCPRFATYIYYDGVLGRSNYDNNAVTGGFRVSF
jgi:outer membrane autotransporter protein